jgi:hypothetical protein
MADIYYRFISHHEWVHIHSAFVILKITILSQGNLAQIKSPAATGHTPPNRIISISGHLSSNLHHFQVKRVTKAADPRDLFFSSTVNPTSQ